MARLTKKQREIADAVFANGSLREKIYDAVDLYCDYEDKRAIVDWFLDAIVYYRKF